MASNPQNPVGEGMNVFPAEYDQFQKFGQPGVFGAAWTVTGNEIIEFTGSKYGAGAVLREGGWDGNIEFGESGTISGSALTPGTIYPFSVRKVSGGSAGTSVLYVLKRNPKLH
ncbi:MAG: hypothetical protein H8E03_01485 [Pelagibacteraceae bacterium]|nr:hypothetical protein [Pelagibacteraceae bacterium]